MPLYAPMSLQDFYAHTLAENGITIPDADVVVKTAEARGEDPVVVKIAKSIYDQTLVDVVPYEKTDDRYADAFKIAQAYVKHVEDAQTASSKLASDLRRVATYAVEGYLAQNGISELTAADGVKIAAVCLEDEMQKIAEPGSDFAMRMLAARKAKAGKGKEEKKEEAPKTEEKDAK